MLVNTNQGVGENFKYNSGVFELVIRTDSWVINVIIHYCH